MRLSYSQVGALPAFFLISFLSFAVHAQTEQEKAEAWAPVQKTLMEQMKLATLLKDANTKEKALNVFKTYSNATSLDSMDVIINNKKVDSMMFYERTNNYLHRNRFRIVHDERLKQSSVDKSAIMDVVYISDGDNRKSAFNSYKEMPFGYKIIFLRKER